MKIRELYLRNFRLFDSFSSEFKDKNIIIGPNGSGKTTIIEAINYASVFSPLRTYEIDKDLVKLGENNFNIFVRFEEDSHNLHTVFVGYEMIDDKGKKKIKFDDKTTNIVSASGKLKVVPFLIEDYELVVGSPSWRRKMIDNFLITTNESYYHNLINYHKFLKQKNASIKLIRKIQEDIRSNQNDLINQTKELIKTYNNNISKFAIEITKHRYEMYKHISERINSYITINVEVKYKSHAIDIIKNSEDPVSDFAEFLNSQIDREIAYEKSIIGPHLDDFVVIIRDKSAKAFLSQGQIRMISIFFKLLSAEYIFEKTNVKPVVLMDDVLGELDDENRRKVLEKVFSLPYQVVLSFFEVPDGFDTSDFNIIRLDK